MSDECPNCGETEHYGMHPAHRSGLRYCEKCELEFWKEGSGWYASNRVGIIGKVSA